MGSAQQSAAKPETGRRIGRYRLRRKIGSGGMGAVYLADIEGPGGFGKWFALKLIHPQFEDSERLLRMFHEEAIIAGRIEHPNVCQVTDFGRDDDGTLYLVLEYLRGVPLSAVMQSIGSELPLWFGPRVVADAARGLHAAHELTTEDGRALGLVHRDVSPQNLFVLFAGPCKVLDFGIARIEGGLVTTREGELRGKLGYMAPEQIDDATSVDRRADVWALGVVLWETLTGKRLFHGGRQTDVVVRVLHERLARPSKHRPECDKVIDEIVLGALRRDRANRIASAGELADRLEDWLHARPERSGHAAVSTFLKAALPEAIAVDERTILELGRDDAALVPTVTPAAPSLRAVPPSPTRSADGVADAMTGMPTTPYGMRARDVTPERSRPSATIVVAIASAVVAVSLCIAVVAWSLREPDPPSRSSALPAPARTPDVVPVATPSPVVLPDASLVVAPAVADSPRRSAVAGSARPSRGGAVVATGQLNLMAIPESDVYLRGRRLGRTPLVGTTLPEGTHRLELRPLNGSARRFVSARISANRTTRLAIRGTGASPTSAQD